MPVITFANPKGGAGKTTAALLLAIELAGQGKRVAILDADPEQWISQWAALPGKPESIRIVKGANEEALAAQIEVEHARADAVIVDLAGTAGRVVARAIGASDLVVIPTQGAAMDAKGGAKAVRLVRHQERMTRRTIPYAILLTRTNAAVTSRAMRRVQDYLATAGIPVFETTIVERAAYRDLFDIGGTLAGLDPAQVSNLDKAQANARAFAAEAMGRLETPASVPAPRARPGPIVAVPSVRRASPHPTPPPSSYTSPDRCRSASPDRP